MSRTLDVHEGLTRYTIELTPDDWRFMVTVIEALYQTHQTRSLPMGIRLDAQDPRLDRILDELDGAIGS